MPRASPSAPGVDAERLAWYLSGPSLALGWYPASCWRGQEPAELPSVDDHAATPTPLGDAFRAALARCVSGCRRAAVLYPGDLASAVLVAIASALCRERSIPLLVLVADGLDSAGASLAARSQAALAGLARGDSTMVLEAERWFRALPVWWNPAGPDFRHTRFVAQASLAATEWGATVLLSSSGGDPLLASPGFLAGRLGRDHARRYLRDRWRMLGPTALFVEALARLGPLNGNLRVAALRLSTSRLARAAGPPPAALAAKARAAVREWTVAWVREAVTAFATNEPAAAETALLRRAAATERLVAGSGVRSLDAAAPAPRRRLPFLDPVVLASSAALPIGDRYNGGLPTPYLRSRTQLVGLVPPWQREHLPEQVPQPQPDQAYSPDPAPVAFPRCADVGLLDRPEPPEGTGAAVVRRLRVLEEWLAGAAKGTEASW